MSGSSTVTFGNISSLQACPTLATNALFNNTTANSYSPLDGFISNTNEINKLIAPYLSGTSALPAELSAIIVLGYMSAVESYLRAVITRIIIIDQQATGHSVSQTLTYGAAVHHTKNLLPEALLEDFSFSKGENISQTLKKFIGVELNINSAEYKIVFEQFDKICELRHCCVHRFGKLGTKQAIKLGLSNHAPHIECPFSPSVVDLQLIADILRTFVKTINNAIFTKLLIRTTKLGPNRVYSWQWHWDYRKDRQKFLEYYNIFYTTLDSPPSANALDVYNIFRHEHLSGML